MLRRLAAFVITLGVALMTSCVAALLVNTSTFARQPFFAALVTMLPMLLLTTSKVMSARGPAASAVALAASCMPWLLWLLFDRTKNVVHADWATDFLTRLSLTLAYRETAALVSFGLLAAEALTLARLEVGSRPWSWVSWRAALLSAPFVAALLAGDQDLDAVMLVVGVGAITLSLRSGGGRTTQVIVTLIVCAAALTAVKHGLISRRIDDVWRPVRLDVSAPRFFALPQTEAFFWPALLSLAISLVITRSVAQWVAPALAAAALVSIDLTSVALLGHRLRQIPERSETFQPSQMQHVLVLNDTPTPEAQRAIVEQEYERGATAVFFFSRTKLEQGEGSVNALEQMRALQAARPIAVIKGR